MYTCGPTVYSTATIGNWRTYVLSDLLVRSLKYSGLQVKHVMNLTDVGHLTGDNEGDSSQGEDRMEKASKREGKTAYEIAGEYSSEFLQQMELLNIEKPDVICKATEHIPEQIELIKKLEEKSFTYKITDGIYFDTISFEKMGNKYGEISNLDELRGGERLEPNPEKKNPRDFALWKFSPLGVRRQMEWDSPWGVGFPGWHVECSAMSQKYLGERFEIHVGGEDLRSTHHPNEIAQSEGATGKKPFVKIWVHGAFLLVDGGRMGKSLGNAYTVSDIMEKSFDPLALRYFYLTGHYRKQLNFTWQGLEAAATALYKLRRLYQEFVKEQERTILSQEKLTKIEDYARNFREALRNDLDFPGALAIVWEVVKSNVPGPDKRALLETFEEVLGIGINREVTRRVQIIPNEVTVLIEERNKMRQEKKWEKADEIRKVIEGKGWKVEDRGKKTIVT